MASNEKTFTLESLKTVYRKTFFFNKFAIERTESGFFLGFWHLHHLGVIVNHFGCFIADVDAMRFVGSFRGYLEKLGGVGEIEESVMQSACLNDAVIVRQLRCTKSGNVAEIDFSFFPLSSAIGQTSKRATIEIEPVAVAISGLDVHVKFVTSYIKKVEEQLCSSPRR
ncbi:MAG: hypothetical protein FWF12_12705 [Betaproteobacteria bacterium]|nr:hypothetical protein [Betaproteobacteria bacterium]